MTRARSSSAPWAASASAGRLVETGGGDADADADAGDGGDAGADGADAEDDVSTAHVLGTGAGRLRLPDHRWRRGGLTALCSDCSASVCC